jgi:hypothetical protein
MADLFDRTFAKVVSLVFLPAEKATARLLGIPARGTIALIFISTIIIAILPIREWIAHEQYGIRCLAPALKESAKAYCDFILVLLQIAIAITIGGIAITEGAVRIAQSLVRSYEDSKDIMLTNEQRLLSEEMDETYKRARGRIENMSLWNLPTTLWGINHDLSSVFRLAGIAIPKFYLSLLVFRFGTAFPGGWYGVIAFILFEGLLAAEIMKMHFDYTPACS